jgi:hypothetical protein
MSWIGKLFSAGTSSLVKSISDAADRFITTDEERNAFTLQVEQLLQMRDSEIEQTIRAELAAKERILVAELKQGDAYTKRARPTVVYVGLGFIGINYVFIPLLARIAALFGAEGIDSTPLTDLPSEFWVAWGGICATWVVGRSAEKRGSRSRVVETVTGNPSPSTKLLN